MASNKAEKADKADEAEQPLKPIGLTEEEAAQKLKEFGPNEFFKFKRPDLIEIIAGQFQIQMLILIGAGVLLLFSNTALAASVFVFITLMVGSETWRELAVRSSIERVRTPYYGKTTVIRDGLTKKVPIQMIFPGDIVLLKAGMVIPADGVVLKATNCKVDESIFGKGMAAKKPEREVAKTFQKEEDPTVVLAGTFVATGECLIRVTATGLETRYSKILGLETARKTELVDSVVKVANSLKPIVLVISFIIFLILLYTTNRFIESAAIAAAVAVAGIPNTIAAVANSLFSFTLERISKVIAIRNERLVDALRKTTVICSEKVSTLTIGRPTVSRMWIDETDVAVTGEGWKTVGGFKGLKSFATLDKLTTYMIASTEADPETADGKIVITGDPMEGAFVVLGMKNRQSVETIRSEYYCWRRETDEDTGVVSTVCGKPDREKLYVIYGPASEVLKKSTVLFSKGKFSKIDDKLRTEIDHKAAEIAADGFDAWAVAYTEKRKGQPKGYALLGLAGVYDPPRPDVKEIIAQTQAAGIRFVVVAEEPTPTALQFARQLGLLKPGTRAMVCDELKFLRPAELRKAVLSTAIFADATPDYEKIIIEELQAAGQTVTFIEAIGTDPKALNAANAGIALESASDKMKYNADGILRNNDLAQVPKAVEEAKAMEKGVERSFYALFASDLSILLVVFLSTITLGGKTLDVQQILLVNFIADTMIGIALAFDRVRTKELKKEVRRFPSGREFTFVFLLALYLAVVSQFAVTAPAAKGIEDSLMFAISVASFIAITLAFVSIDESVINAFLHPSPRIMLAAMVALVMLAAAFYLPPLPQFIGLKPLSQGNWMVVGGIALSVILVTEAKKQVFKLR